MCLRNIILGIILIIYPMGAYGIDNFTDEKRIFIDKKIEIIHDKLEQYSPSKRERIYKHLHEYLLTRRTSENERVIAYILPHFLGEGGFVQPHNSIILRFSRGGNHDSILDAKKNAIFTKGSVFIFRNNQSDLSRSDIQYITKKIRSINKNILIFIDQEGGYVNRYVDFESGSEVDGLFGEAFVTERLELLSKQDQLLIRSLFPYYSGYYPSMGKLGQRYDSFDSELVQKYFLEIIAYIRLKSLKDNGINTYGLVADLNYGNPAISGSSRSFSQHGAKYKVLIDAFIKSSQETGVSIYLKHFPGHGAGTVDSHKGILDLSLHQKYLKENLNLFEYFLENSQTQKGLMVAHILFPKDMLEEFNTIISQANYILTDDLAMQGFKKICSTSINGYSCTQQTSVFSTEQIFGSQNLIKVDTQYVENVY